MLEGDVTLTAPLALASSTHLNCQGHRILPATPGTGTFPSDYASVPEVAIVLDKGVHGVKIQNCRIGGASGETSLPFDFGIYARGSKLPDDRGAASRLRTKILNNTINARYLGIGLSGVDDTLVADNTVNLLSPGGVGIEIAADSDRNRILGNTVTRVPALTPTARRTAPGRLGGASVTAFGINVSSPRANAVTQSIIAGVLFQTPQAADHLPLNEDNVVEGNAIDMNRGPSESPADTVVPLTGIVVMDFGTRTAVRDNLVQNGTRGLTLNTSATPATSTDRRLPGTCVGGTGAGRPCGAAADCYMAPPVYTDTVAGVCSGVAMVPSDPLPHDTVFEGNVVTGAYEGASIQTGIGVTLRGNSFVGAVTNGIMLGGPALSGGTLVTRNVIRGNRQAGLLLTYPSASPRFGELSPPSFGARVTLNDITGGGSGYQAIRISPLYTLPTELSSMQRGNYWGRTCDEGGFREFGQPGADSPAVFVVDSHPYGRSVAAVPEASLPPTCR